MREGVNKIEYDVEGNKTIMDLYYDTGCAFRETYLSYSALAGACT